MMNWAEYEPENLPKRGTILPYLMLAAIVVGLGLALWTTKVFAEPIAKAEGDNGAVIILYNDPCAMTDQVSNLPYKAEWREGGKVFAGCWGPHPAGAVVSYWSDKTVALIPFQSLQRLAGA